VENRKPVILRYFLPSAQGKGSQKRGRQVTILIVIIFYKQLILLIFFTRLD